MTRVAETVMGGPKGTLTQPGGFGEGILEDSILTLFGTKGKIMTHMVLKVSVCEKALT